MDAVTAGLLGASIGVVGSLSGSLLVPHLTARRARETKLLELRQEAYVQALLVMQKLGDSKTAADLDDAARAMLMPITKMRLLASPDIVDLYADVFDAVTAARKAVESGVDSAKAVDAFNRIGDSVRHFIDGARAHIGVDGMPD